MSEKILTIQRSKWRRGGDACGRLDSFGETSLLNAMDLMCCLGFDALACGLTVDQIRGVGDPESLDLDLAPESYRESARFDTREYYQAKHSPTVDLAIRHNDDTELSDAEREVLIREDLKALGWDDVVFVD